MSVATDHVVVPAGWYPDPFDSHLLRWWTGETWTERLEHRRPEIQIAPGAVDSLAAESRINAEAASA